MSGPSSSSIKTLDTRDDSAMSLKLTRSQLSAILISCGNRKLRARVQQLIMMIERLDRQTRVAIDLDQYYYIEKEAEMRLLEEKLEEALDRLLWLSNRMEVTFDEVFLRWRNDVRNLPDATE